MFVHYRTLDRGKVVFCTEKSTLKCGEESTIDHTSLEEIGPQEGDASTTNGEW